MQLEALESRTLMAAHTVTVPLRANDSGNFADNLIVGHESHLGKITGAFNADGVLVITAANGDQLFALGTLTPTDDPAEFQVNGSILGGTGRFAGATGAVSHPLTFVNDQGDFVFTLDVMITLQRPWKSAAE